METGVFFLEGDNKGRFVFGIPEHLREWRTLLPADEIWCGDEDCCPRMEIEDEILTYYLVPLGRLLRVATRDKDLAINRDRLIFEVAKLANRAFENSMEAFAYSRQQEKTTPA
ncbi:hypothetical protein NXC12_PD00006 (plasmid) [Rhizobium etli]|uniref:Uncharacterized protein n=1 Tax=Rhizobium etli TaxID=29449 RepID=A0AAN1BL03_RHIET|nr:hypothetical protein [Rhizobium etli]ARQ13119.1 hypothetical protein NXC12_PD00006 [Rhizobium etli]